MADTKEPTGTAETPTHDYLLRIDLVTYQAIENVALRRRQDGDRGYSVRQLMTEILNRGVARMPEVRDELKRLTDEKKTDAA